MSMRSALLIFLIGLFVIPSSATRAEKRVALIVGISRYQQVPQLGNPVRDSEAMAALFKRAGFDVVDSRRDLGVAELRRALRQFSEVCRDADIAVVYYAGHGIEVDGINYLNRQTPNCSAISTLRTRPFNLIAFSDLWNLQSASS
jgi:hypothetical protein